MEQARELRYLVLERRPVPKTILESSLNFIVEVDGTLSEISAKGENQSNKEIERAVKSIQTKWIPSEANGKKIRSRMNFPIKMVFS